MKKIVKYSLLFLILFSKQTFAADKCYKEELNNDVLIKEVYCKKSEKDLSDHTEKKINYKLALSHKTKYEKSFLKFDILEKYFSNLDLPYTITTIKWYDKNNKLIKTITEKWVDEVAFKGDKLRLCFGCFDSDPCEDYEYYDVFKGNVISKRQKADSNCDNL